MWIAPIKGDMSEFYTKPAAQKCLIISGANSSSEEEEENTFHFYQH